MIKAVQISPDREKEWNKLLFNSINCTYLSSIPYAYTKKSIGKSVETFLFQENDEIIAGVHYSVKSILCKIIRIADIQSGFLFKQEPSENNWSFLLDHFIQWANLKNACYVRFNSWLPAIIGGEKTTYKNLLTQILKSKGFNLIQTGRHTYWIDLTKSEEELLQQMKRQTRYEINRAVSKPFIIERFDAPTNELFETFWGLYHDLGQEKGFGTLGKEQFRDEFFSLMNAGFANLFIVRCQNVVVNVSLASNLGRAAYLYGAMNPDFKTISQCTSPGQIAQWEMIKFMKSKNIKIYDMGFCPGSVPLRDHPQYPIWRFKYGFGGAHVQFLPIYGKVLKPLRGRLFQFLKYR